MTVTVHTLDKVGHAIHHLRTYGQHALADAVASLHEAFMDDHAPAAPGQLPEQASEPVKAPEPPAAPEQPPQPASESAPEQSGENAPAQPV